MITTHKLQILNGNWFTWFSVWELELCFNSLYRKLLILQNGKYRFLIHGLTWVWNLKREKIAFCDGVVGCVDGEEAMSNKNLYCCFRIRARIRSKRTKAFRLEAFFWNLKWISKHLSCVSFCIGGYFRTLCVPFIVLQANYRQASIYPLNLIRVLACLWLSVLSS